MKRSKGKNTKQSREKKVTAAAAAATIFRMSAGFMRSPTRARLNYRRSKSPYYSRAVMDICHGADTRYRAAPSTKKHRGGIIDDEHARATVTADQIFTTPTSLDVYNFRANRPRTHHSNGRARASPPPPPPASGKSYPLHIRRPRCDFVNISARKY